jgi:hypothetical protein
MIVTHIMVRLLTQRSIVLLLVIGVILSLHLLYQPYQLSAGNRVESLSLSTLLVLASFNIATSTHIDGKPQIL